MGLEQLGLNRTQLLVLGFFIFAWVALVVILVAAPEVYDQALRLPGGERKLPTLAFLTALSAFLVLLGVGVVRRLALDVLARPCCLPHRRSFASAGVYPAAKWGAGR